MPAPPGAAAIFGARAPVAKLLLAHTSPWLLAGVSTWATVWGFGSGACFPGHRRFDSSAPGLAGSQVPSSQEGCCALVH